MSAVPWALPNQRTALGPASHLQALDTLRGLAACGVFVGHFTRQFFSSHHDQAWWLVLDRLGVIGVAVFFVLSGFLIHAGGIKELQRQGRIDWASYARRRFWRIYPAYAVALVVYSLLAGFLPSDNTHAATWVGFFSHLLLVSNFLPGHMHSINGVFWSVVVECHFYMLYPLFIWLARRWPAGHVLLSILLAGAAFFLAATLLTQRGEARNLWQQAAPATFWKWVLGALLAEMWLNQRFVVLRRLLSQPWMLVPVLAGLYAGTFAMQGAFELAHHRFVLPFVAAALVGLCIFSPLSQVRWALGEWLGQVSYSVYLWHPLAIALALLAQALCGNNSGWLALGVALSLSLAFAALSYQWVERPCMDRAKGAHGRPHRPS